MISPFPSLMGILILLTDHGVSSSDTMTIPLIPHHVQVRRRLGEVADASFIRRRTEAEQVGALYHGYGTHYIDLWCGTPPQRQTVIVDTGSGITAFPCTGCHNCGAPRFHIDNYFVESNSSTFSKLSCGHCSKGSCQGKNCHISMSYAEGSTWSALEAKDTCYVGGPHNVALPDDISGHTEDIDPDHASHFAFDLTFGCQTKVTGLFKTQLADGIMGMENAGSSFWKQMFKAGKMEDPRFSLCFSRPPLASRNGTEAGAMTLGGVDTRLHDSRMVYIQLTSGRGGFYSVRIRAMYLRHAGGGESAKPSNEDATRIDLYLPESSLNQGGVIVDSGTTDTYWNKKIAEAFKGAFKDLTGLDYGNEPMTLTEEQLNSLPTVLFQLRGDSKLNAAIAGKPNVVSLAGDIDPEHPNDVIWAFPPSHYMEMDKDGNYVARFYVDEHGGSVLGANSMMGHDVLFDAHNLHLGLAQSDCDYHSLVTEGGFTDVLEETEVGSGHTGGKTHHPSNTQGSQNPLDDAKKTVTDLAKSCDSNGCRGGFAAVTVIATFLFCYCFRCMCSPRPRNRNFDKHQLEMASNGFSNYRDEEGYSDDPTEEYGEFETQGTLS